MGCASDFYAFDQSSLKKELDKEDFLVQGYCLFGDNAYVNSPNMCTPWRNMHKPMPVNLSIQNISSSVLALCKLHNFCIDNASDQMECPEEVDILNIAIEGGQFLPRMDNNRQYFWECDVNVYSESDRLNDLLDDCAHMDNHMRGQRGKYNSDRNLPCY
ncbi:hypothetical protein ACHAW6_013108 [Cyclotella cf. meneghiniana]